MSDDFKLNLGITDEGLKALAGEAVLRAIDQATRDTLIKSALTHLLSHSGSTGYGGRRYSPLEDAFHAGMRNVADKLVQEFLDKDDSVKVEVQKLIAEAWNKMQSVDLRTKIVDNMANAIAKSFIF